MKQQLSMAPGKIVYLNCVPQGLASTVKPSLRFMCAGLLVSVACATSASEPKKRFDIPQVSAQKALLYFAHQAGVQVLLPSHIFQSIDANAVTGEYSIEDALNILFRGTSVRAVIDKSGHILVESKTNEAGKAEIQGEQKMAVEDRKKSSLLASAIAVVVSSGSGSVQSQENQASNGGLEEITITGSRIRQTDGMVTPVPVTTLTTNELNDFEPGGTIAEQLDALPQFFGTQTAQRGGGALWSTAGGSYLNMRGLGANRTLVLFDGARVVPADKRGSVNVDTFPTALIRTVDVVTGGASAAYGADAMGGVVNFVLDREFEGLKLEAGTGITEWGDGERWNFSVAGGKQLGERLHLVGSFEARHINQIQRDPAELGDWFQRYGWVTNPAWTPGAPAGVPQRLTLPWVTSSEHTPTGVIWARNGTSSSSPLIPFAYNGQTFLEDGSATRPLVHGDVYAAPNSPGSTKSMSGGPEARNHMDAYRGGPDGRETVGRSGFAGAKYAFSDTVSGFAQVMVGRSESGFRMDRGDFSLQDGWFATVYRDNAFLPANIASAMDGAGIDSFQLHKNGSYVGSNDINEGSHEKGVFTTYSWSIGIDAMLPNGWDMRASWQSGESHKRTGVFNETRIDRLFLAMDAVRDPQTGAIVCNVQLNNPSVEELAASVEGHTSSLGGPLPAPVGLDNTVRDCMPINIMGAGGLSKAAMDYTGSPKIGDSYVDQDFAEVLVTGEVFEGWAGPVSMASGLTYREQSFSDQALPVEIDRLGPPLNVEHLGIRGIPPGYANGSFDLHQFATVGTASGEYDVWEWFAELNTPLWQSDRSVQRLDGSVAYRASHYSNIGRIESWKSGLDLQVIESLRLRATKSRDVREASFTERFGQQGGGGSVNDPRFDNTNFQITSLIGGNPDLRPEVADTIVAGVVYQPVWIEGLQISADWYEVKIKDAVSTLGFQRIVDECELNGVQELCSQYDRDPVTGFIGRIQNLFLNVAQARVEGVDFEVAYNTEPDFLVGEYESLNLRVLGGYLMERSDTPFGGQALDVAGDLGMPEWMANATLAYSAGPYSIQVQQRYIAGTARNIRWEEGVDVDDNTIPSGNYTNLRLGYNGDMSSGGTWNVAFSVTNLFDRHPPIIPNFSTRGGAQSVSNDHDVFGRRYQMSVRMGF